MKDKKLVRIIGLVLFIALIAWTVSTITGAPEAPSADALGGADSQAYLDAKAAYDAEIKHGHALLTLGALVVVAFFFITEAIPIAFAAMVLPPYFAVSGIMTMKEAYSGLMDSNVILFGGMFVVGGAMFQTGLAQKIGLSAVKIAGGSESKLLIAVMVMTGAMSAFLSNTGTVAVLMPVCLGIADSQNWNRAKILMPLAIMASSGGMCTLVGTPPNITANATLANAGIEVGFFDYALFGLPVAIISVVYMMVIGNRLVPERHSDVEVADEETGKVYDTKKQIIAGAVLVGVIVCMVTKLLDLHDAAVIGAILCVVTGCMTEKEAYQSFDWQTIFLFAGALGLASAMKSTGAGKILADQVVSMMGEAPNPIVLTAVLFLITGMLTQFMSNTAAAALLCPIGLSIAESLGASPTAVVLAIGFSASAAYMTPVATPPNTMIYGPGGLQFMDYVKVGTPLFIIVMIMALILLPIIWPFFPNA